jgi:hypothetical protein
LTSTVNTLTSQQAISQESNTERRRAAEAH